MMAKAKTHMVVDVETIGKKLVFDIAWSIGNRHAIERTENFIVKEIFTMENIASFPFHGERKARRYGKLVQAGEIPVENWRNIMMTLYHDIKEYQPTIWAYNAAFDVSAIALTNQKIKGREFKMFDNSNIYDLYTAWCTVMQSRKDYRRFCMANGLISPAGNIRTKAETAIRFIRDEPDYVEQHMAAQDTIDEFELLQYLILRKKKRNIKAMVDPWRLVNK